MIHMNLVAILPDVRYRQRVQKRLTRLRKRLLALDPGLDLAVVRTALAAIATVCAGGENAGTIGRLGLRERFHWLVAPRSTMIQTSAVHTGRCDDLAATLDKLLDRMVRTVDPSTPSAWQ